MSLYDILSNKPCVWLLKELYEAEVVNKKVYTIKLSDIKKYFKIKDAENYIAILQNHGLLHVDDLSDDTVVSLNQKGKDFFKTFDRLKILLESEVRIIEEKPLAKIEYGLTPEEKDALFTVYKISQVVGSEMPVKALILEDEKMDVVYDKLQKLNLIAKVKNSKGKMTITLTPSGKKVLQEEIGRKLRD